MNEYSVYYPIYYSGMKCTWQRIMDVMATSEKQAIEIVTQQWGPAKQGFYKAVRKEN
jgi:hypothetical protein